MNINDLRGGTKELVAHYPVGRGTIPIQFSINIDALTIARLHTEPMDVNQAIEWVVAVVSDWDLEIDDGSKIPLKPEAITAAGVPFEVLQAIIQAVNDDVMSLSQEANNFVKGLVYPDVYGAFDEVVDAKQAELYSFFSLCKWARIPPWELINRPAVFYEGLRSAMALESKLRAQYEKRGAQNAKIIRA